MKIRTTVAALAALAVGGYANAQLIVGVDDPTLNVKNNTPPGSGTYVDLFTGADVWGMAWGNSQLHISEGAEYVQYTLAGTRTDIGNFTSGGSTVVMVGLAWANGMLFGYTQSSTEGFYSIDTSSGNATLELAVPSADFDFGGIAYNPLDGLFYGTNDDTTAGRGLYSIDVFGGGGINLVAAYPNSETDIDALAIGNNTAYLVDDDGSSPGGGPGLFYSYDLSQGAGGSFTSFAAPWSTSEVFAGAAMVPAPGAIALLGVAGLVSRRRRKA